MDAGNTGGTDGATGGAGGGNDASPGDASDAADASDASGDGPLSCNLTTPCPTGQTCVMDGTCAQSCTVDGGADAASPCPAGTTCQSTSGFCVGTGCTAVLVMVCR